MLLAALCVPVTAVDGLENGQQGDALLNEGREGGREGREGGKDRKQKP